MSDRLELIKETRFANPGFANCRDDLPAPALCEFERAFQLREFGLATNESGQSPRRADACIRVRRGPSPVSS